MTFAWRAEDLAALKAKAIANKTCYYAPQGAWYEYVEGTGASGNDEWRIASTPGSGIWFATGFVEASTTPTGYAAKPVIVSVWITGSAGLEHNGTYMNPGGVSIWIQLSVI